MESVALLDSLKGIQVFLVAASIALARMSGMIIIMPAFTRMGLSGILRGGVALALSLPLLPFVMSAMPPASLGFGQMAAILLKEVAIGATIGLVLGVPIWAAEGAGEILDLQRGVGFADLLDPSATTANNIAGSLFAITMVALFFTSGGLSLTLRAMYDSYSLWPLASFTPILSAESGRLLLAILDDILGIGLMLVAPIVLAMLLADLSLALVARAAPHLNIFVLSLTVKNLVFSLVIVLYGAFLLSYMREDLAWIVDGTAKLRPYAPPQP